jgi:hypothetical protein
VVGETVNSLPKLRELVIDTLKAKQNKLTHFDPELKVRLRQRERELLKQIEVMTSVHCDMPREHLAAMTEPRKNELRKLKDKIQEAEFSQGRQSEHIDIEATADGVIHRLTSMFTIKHERDQDTNCKMRELMRTAIKSLTVHPVTFVVEAEIGIPSWVLSPPFGPITSGGGTESRDLVPMQCSLSEHKVDTIWLHSMRFSGQYERRTTKGWWSAIHLHPA